MASTLADMSTLADFRGTIVREGKENLTHLGPLLCNPLRVTFPWPPLKAALESIFQLETSTNIEMDLDLTKITAGWAGLSLILTAFRRLEVLEEKGDTEQCLAWLSALRMATIRKSIAAEDPDQPNVLRTILDSLLEPPSPEIYQEIALKKELDSAFNGFDPSPEHDPSLLANTHPNSLSNDDEDYIPPDPSIPTKITLLAHRLSQATKIPISRCIQTLSRLPESELDTINPDAPIPALYLDSVKPKVSRKSTGSIGSIGNGNDGKRPNFSYSALIGQAILSVPEKRMRLSEIYDYVANNYSYYQKSESGWQNSIRHNLSLQAVFVKVPDNSHGSGGAGKKGCWWTILPEEEWRFEGGGWNKMDKPGASGSGRVRGLSRSASGSRVKRKATTPPGLEGSIDGSAMESIGTRTRRRSGTAGVITYEEGSDPDSNSDMDGTRKRRKSESLDPDLSLEKIGPNNNTMGRLDEDDENYSDGEAVAPERVLYSEGEEPNINGE